MYACVQKWYFVGFFSLCEVKNECCLEIRTQDEFTV